MTDHTITKTLVDKLTPQPAEYSVWDSKLPGFGVRVRPTGAKSFVVVYRAGFGRGAPSRRFTIGAVGKLAPEAARTRAKQILGAVAHGRDPAAEKAIERSAMTVGELGDHFIEHHARKKLKATTCNYYSQLLENKIKPDFGNLKADKLTRSAVSKSHASRGENRVTSNRTLSLLSAIYAFGSREGLIAEGFNPARGTPKFKESARERFLSIEDLERLGTALREAETVGLPWEVDESAKNGKHIPKKDRFTKINPAAAAALRLLILTGCRLREILDLKWEYVDFERGLLFLPDSKTGRKTVVLNAPALAVLNGLERVSSFVIPGEKPRKLMKEQPEGLDQAAAGASERDQGHSALSDRPRSDLKKPWAAVSKRAGLSGVRLHDLRHTYASFGVGGGLGLPIIGKLLGHAQSSTTARYAHLDNDPLRKATEKIGAEIAAAMGENICDDATIVSLPQRDRIPSTRSA